MGVKRSQNTDIKGGFWARKLNCILSPAMAACAIFFWWGISSTKYKIKLPNTSKLGRKAQNLSQDSGNWPRFEPSIL
jgi:hypothetical protein